uniref:Sodium/myo-inositol cotransporter n=1 Tax=Trichobilharzia regenti TaxID=157069 RepID=A0AA85KD16_TRIRE|nr:unnamed protein product [Trichobilharzia regenti]
MHIKVDQWDVSVIIIYLIALLGAGIYSLFAHRRGTVTDYFLAGRFITWLPIGASLFASNIGSEHFIGLAGSGAASGIAVGAFELNASIILQLLGWVFLPVYIASGVSTLPEYMKKRFGGDRIKVYLAVLSLLLYIFTKISVNLYSGSLFLTEALHWNTWLSIIIILIITAVITTTGGLAAVLYTDTLQFFIMISGATILTILSFIKVGGFPGLLAAYGGAIAEVDATSKEGLQLITSLGMALNTTNSTSLLQLSNDPRVPSGLRCSLPSPKAFKLLREIDDRDMPWLGFLLGQTPASIWYWCADQMMVQRTLAAKSLSHAQSATLMTGLIKQLPLFIMVIPGMISRVLYANEIACFPGTDCMKVCGHESGCSNMAYPKLVIGLMPSGLRGLMLAVMLAALISDLTSIFNSSSTLFTMDIYRQFRQKAQNMELMIVGRVFVVVLVGLSVAWVPIIQQFQGSQLYIYIQSTAAYLTPPIAAVYLCAVLWKRSNEKGAFTGLMYGLITGFIRMILAIVYNDPICGEIDSRPWIIKEIHYMYFAVFSFMSTALLVVIVSLCSKPPTPSQLYHLTYWTAWDSNSEDKDNNDDNNVDENDDSNNSSNNHKNALDSFDIKPSQIQSINGDVGSYDALTLQSNGYESVLLSKSKSNTDRKNSRSLFKSIFMWLCGFEDWVSPKKSSAAATDDILTESEKLQALRKAEERTQARLHKITCLHQDPRAKLVLRIGLILIILLTITGYIFYSTYFDEISIGPLIVTTTTTTNQTSPLEPHLSELIAYLQRHNLIKVRNQTSTLP